MRALQLFGDRDLRLTEIDPPAPPAEGEVQVRVRAIGLNYLDLWGFRGMAFAKRKMPQVVGVEAAGEVAAVGPGGSRFKVGDPVVMYGAETCGHCRACREGRDNLCENVAGILGFHLDGFARALINRPERLVVPVPQGVTFEQAACAPGGSGIGTSAIKMAKPIGCTAFTTVGDDEKGRGAKALVADHVINYKTERFEGEVRKLTKRKGVDVVFEHVGADTWNGSLLCLKRGGRLVTCGSTSGVSATMNLMQLFQQQYRIFGSFGCSLRNIADALAKMAGGLTPVIDAVYPLDDFAKGLGKLEARQAFGKVIVTF